MVIFRLDIVDVLRGESNYEKKRNYWKYFKSKLKSEGNQLCIITAQFKFISLDGKQRYANVLYYDSVKKNNEEFFEQKH